MSCLGSSAGRGGQEIPPLTAKSCVLDGSEHPAEERWAPSQACWAEVSVHGFQGSPKLKVLWENMNLGMLEGESSPLYHIMLVLQLFWESAYSCPAGPHPTRVRRV